MTDTCTCDTDRFGCLMHPGGRAQPPPACRGFHWIGQTWEHCDNCSRPWYAHDGLHCLRRGASPFGHGEADWYIKPWPELRNHEPR